MFHASQFAEGLVKELHGPNLWFVLDPKEGSNLRALARKKGRAATKDARYATKYLDTTGTLGISIPDFDS